MLIPFLLLAIALSFSLAEPLQKIEKGIQEFPSRLFPFFINPIFVISVIFVCFAGAILLIILKYNSRIKYEKELVKEKETIKKPAKRRTKKVYLENPKNELKLKIKEPNEEEDSQKQELYKPLPIGTYGRSVNIRVDENKRYFHKKNISKDEIKYLLNKNYQIKKYKNLLSGRMENFLLCPRFNESFTHLFLTKNISEFLEKNGIETELYITKKPDIVFRIKGKRYAIEIETGSIFSKIERMKEKLEVLKDYNEWFFVVTDRNKVKKYKKYGDSVDKRYIKSRLDKLVKLAKKAQK